MGREPFETLEQVMMADAQLRVWCFRCGRWRDIRLEQIGRRDGISGDTTLRELEQRFRCSECRLGDQIRVLPASIEHVTGFSRTVGIKESNTAMVAHFFHAMRSAAKRRR